MAKKLLSYGHSNFLYQFSEEGQLNSEKYNQSILEFVDNNKTEKSYTGASDLVNITDLSPDMITKRVKAKLPMDFRQARENKTCVDSLDSSDEHEMRLHSLWLDIMKDADKQ